MEFEPHPALRKYPQMEFLFHSVIEHEGHMTYYNVYKIEDDHFFAECHHFNNKQSCENDFELYKRGDDWTPADANFESQAQRIGEEIDRMSRDGRSGEA